MENIVLKFAICNEVFQGWTWDAACQFAAQSGYDGIELAPFTLTPDIRTLSAEDRVDVRASAAKYGIEIMGLHWLLVSPPGLSLTTADPAVRRETASYLRSLVELCSDLGGRVMTLGSPKQRRVEEGETVETTRERFLEGVRPALDGAYELGIVICLEPLPPPESNFLFTLAEARSLIESLNHPAAKTNFDIKSACWENRPLPELFLEFAPHIAHFHANDTNLRGPGFGDTDYRPILKGLHQAGYEGYISVEPFDYSPDPQTVAVKSLEYLKSCI